MDNDDPPQDFVVESSEHLENIEAERNCSRAHLGETIEIESKLSRGTTLATQLPLTLAIIPALIVKSEKDSFALPQLNMREPVRVKELLATPEASNSAN